MSSSGNRSVRANASFLPARAGAISTIAPALFHAVLPEGSRPAAAPLIPWMSRTAGALGPSHWADSNDARGSPPSINSFCDPQGAHLQQREITVRCPYFLGCRPCNSGSLVTAPGYESSCLEKTRSGTRRPGCCGLPDARAGPGTTGSAAMGSRNVRWILPGGQEDADKKS
jgi:hypothetical protein